MIKSKKKREGINMGRLITKAIPTDKVAIEYLKNNSDLHEDFAISPFTARSLFNHYVLDKRNFICPTKNCSAPITCRSISKDSKNSPTFVNQSISENKHISYCNYHPSNYDRASSKKDSNNEKFKYSKSGDIVSDLSITNGFSPRKTHKTKRESTRTSEIEGNTATNYYTKKQIKSDAIPTKPSKEHLKTLQDHVEMYKSNPEFKITSQISGAIIPIKFLFKPIYKNYLFENLKNRKYPSIYYGLANLKETNNDKVLRIVFKMYKTHSNEQTYNPSLLILKDYIQNEYTDVYDSFINKNKTSFEVYTTLPLFWNYGVNESIYLNVCSFQEEITVNPFSDELFYNIYIS